VYRFPKRRRLPGALILILLTLLVVSCATIAERGEPSAEAGNLERLPPESEAPEADEDVATEDEQAERTPAPADTIEGRIVPYELLTEGSQSSMLREMTLAIETEQQFLTIWRVMHENRAELPPLPEVDFATQIVLAVFAGRRPTGGYEPEILRVEVEGETLLAYYRIIAPDPDDIVSQVITTPYVMVTVPPFAGFIDFEKVED
jgi:hypothetical protein